MVDLITFERALLQAPNADQALFIGPEQTLSIAEFVQRVADWQHHFDNYQSSQPDVQRFAVFHPDLCEFAAILFALWSRSAYTCLPANNQPGTIEQLQNQVDALVGEFDARTTDPLITSAPCYQAALQPLAFNYDSALLEIFTSGSSGEPKAISKTLRQLAMETTLLEQQWIDDAGQHIGSIATVSHQHIYGLLYRLLWPISHCRPMWRYQCAFIEDVAVAAQHQQAHPFMLISSPTHLSRLPDDTNWPLLQQTCQLVFSSGAPLSSQASIQSATAFAADINEILGSTETGGIAWRRQHQTHNMHWRAGAGVSVRCEPEQQRLQVRSPFLPDSQWYTTQDRAEFLANGTFVLQGRTDRIVKVEGKRMSLTALEQQLQNNDWVEEARATLLQGQRDEIALVLVLTTRGQHYLQQHGRKRLQQQLRLQLADHFEAPLLPRKWRIVLTLPRNTQGKVTQQQLLALFQPAASDALLLAELQDGEHIQLQLKVPEQSPWFEGHFDDNPILPGVVQTQWAIDHGQRFFNLGQSFLGLKNIKFMHPILPGSYVTLTLSTKTRTDCTDLIFTYSNGDTKHASGAISFATADVA